VAYLSAPASSVAKTAEALGVTIVPRAPVTENRRAPGEWLEHSGFLTVLVCSMGFTYLGKVILAKGPRCPRFEYLQFLVSHDGPTSALDAPRFHPFGQGRGPGHRWCTHPISVLCRHFWHDHQILDISHQMAQFFVRTSTPGTYPVLIAVYSAVLGLFLPSAGSKWLIEAPYLLQAATQLHVNLGWVVQIYNTAEALPNLINPFWMLPLLGLLNVPARQLIGYTALQLIVNLPLVLLILWVLARTLPYGPPHFP
jgi:short-chain fatty acids transporter